MDAAHRASEVNADTRSACARGGRWLSFGGRGYRELASAFYRESPELEEYGSTPRCWKGGGVHRRTLNSGPTAISMRGAIVEPREYLGRAAVLAIV